METYYKAVACVLKDIETDPKILCFVHPPPKNDFQIPKGTVEKDEAYDIAVLRELEEESGISKCEIVNKIGVLKRICKGGPNGDQKEEIQLWQMYHIEAKQDLAENWTHIVTGGGLDDGMAYKYFWHSLNSSDFKKFDNVFVRCFDKIKVYLEIQTNK